MTVQRTELSARNRTASGKGLQVRGRGGKQLLVNGVDGKSETLEREGSQQRERNLHRRRLRGFDELEVIGLPGMLAHGGSFVVWLPPP